MQKKIPNLTNNEKKGYDNPSKIGQNNKYVVQKLLYLVSVWS